jgi:ElaB/YqjD/DUF883 family membrane-anchored ribosome-binding protein
MRGLAKHATPQTSKSGNTPWRRQVAVHSIRISKGISHLAPATNNIKNVNTDIHPEPTTSPPPEPARNISWRAGDTAKEAAERADVTANEFTDATRDTAKRVADTAKEIYHLSAVKAEETLAVSKEYVRRNPVSVLLGAVAVGAALGYVMMMAKRKPTFGERYADEPIAAVRDAILGALAPVTQRVHSGYDSALDGAGKAMDRIHRFSSGDSFSHRIGRIGNNLKFW